MIGKFEQGKRKYICTKDIFFRFKGEERLEENEKYKKSNYSLVIEKAQVEDHGMYKCMATSGESFNITVVRKFTCDLT